MPNNSTNANGSTVPCGIFNVQDCSPGEIDDEQPVDTRAETADSSTEPEPD